MSGGMNDGGTMDLIALIRRQRAFSLRTFGPGPRTQGVIACANAR